MRALVALVLVWSLSCPVVARAELRDVGRARAFVLLHEPGSRGSVSGSVEGKTVSLYASATYVSGTGPHGHLTLSIFGTTASGNSGGHHVSLRNSNGWVSGQGYHGSVSLHQFGSSISGYVGTEHVQVRESNGWASGTFGGQSVSLSAFGSNTPSLIALLLASF
jgi:hypothetical protein